MNFFCWIIILIGSIHPSLGNDFSSGQNLSKIDHIQQLIQKEEGTDWTKESDSKIESMLLEECQFVKNHGKIAKFVLNNVIMLGAEGHGCQSLLKGELFSDGTELVEKVTLAFQTGGQKLIENLKRKEIEAKIAVNGGGTLAEILPPTKVDNILRMLEAKMSVGPAKDAVQNLLAQNSGVMPSDMVQLVMNLWKIYSHNHVYVHPQIRREHPRTRRKRDAGMQRILTELGLFLVILLITFSLIDLVKGGIGMINDLLEFQIIVLFLAFFIFAFIHQQPIYKKLATKFGG
ncbi:hypothetical protein GPALN_010824 [Globodera pallida]|nr:hypothetical protein GPALN_010824 [Globodera pallida]